MNNVNNPFENKSGGEILAMFLGVAIALVVAVFLGIHTLNFFEFAFPAEQSIYAYLGFALTGGGFIAYLVILKWGSKDTLSSIIAVIMLAVCGIGELIAFGYGIEVETFRKNGVQFTNEEVIGMTRFIQALAGLHSLALVMKFVGADVVNAFGKKSTNEKSNVQSKGNSFTIPSPFPVNQDKTDFLD